MKPADDSHDCVKVLDLEGHLVSINESGCRILELDDPQSLVGKSWIELWAGADFHVARAAITRAARGETVTFQAFGYTMKHRGRYWESEITPLMGADGKPRQLRVVTRDITDRRQPEQS